MKLYKSEIFKAGEQTDSAGNKKRWTKEHLKEMVANFKGGETVPLRLGHIPKDGDPAVGWLSAVSIEGDTLIGEFSLTDYGQNLIEKGYYRNRSIGLVISQNGVTIDHVALLGAQKPAVKDLAAMFSSDDKTTTIIIFEEEKTVNYQELFEKLAAQTAPLVSEQVAKFATLFPEAKRADVIEWASANLEFTQIMTLNQFADNAKQEQAKPKPMRTDIATERTPTTAFAAPSVGALMGTPEQIASALK